MKKPLIELNIILLLLLLLFQVSAGGDSPSGYDTNTVLEMMLIGCLLVIGFFSLILFFIFRKEMAYASFGSLCLLLAFG